ncbi:myb-related transcription factor, partner of profilin [Ochotona curzoniae]|uniref:myb-related transcription factor, partner of profilin-like n=1 Tax=Ochotona curzoniae TaxID=130825 RepID=UPI001B3488D9|nr:myb-related transcription factor, partner of profilin-like [Ochotona curzoniae]XP_040852177.1 myb-related transcription factor, partner of profilin [Ochotona curzoniae]
MASAAAVAATTGEAEETTRLRKPRFSFEENQILIREVRAHYPQLYGAQSRRVSVAERRRVWDGIAAKINGISSWKRTGQEVQKRWNDFKRRTKEKLARVPHSTQGTGPAAEDAFSAEEETIFAILGPGVTGPGIEEEPAAASALAAAAATASPQPTAPGAGAVASRYALSDSRREERRAEAPAHGKGGSSSPQPWARPPSSHAQEGGCPRPKERECPPSAAPQPVQLPRLALSPPPSAPPPLPPAAPAQVALSPPPRPPSMSSNPEPSLDFLRAQQETASAIRELADTLRQGLAKLSEALSALLPLLPGTPGEPRASPPLPPPPLPSPPPPPPPGPVLPPPAPKVELSPEPVSVVAAVVDGAVVANRGVIIAPRSEEGAPRPPQATLPPHDSPPHKRRKGFPTRKRRGRWKSP